jgi:hypothetical protein
VRQSQSFLVVVVGLLLLWLAVTGRLEAVWSALVGAASGELAPAGDGGGSGGGRGGGGGSVGSGPILGVTLPDYMEFITPGYDRYVPVGDGRYRTIKGGEWARHFRPVTP